MIALMTMIGGGVFDEFPSLWVYLESGCGWALHWMERLDDQAKLRSLRCRFYRAGSRSG
jgi:hypothetical protein